MYTTAELFIMAFSPPYGDGTKSFYPMYPKIEFSPPYGDGTMMFVYNMFHSLFSPPYGDGTLNISQKIVKWKS